MAAEDLSATVDAWHDEVAPTRVEVDRVTEFQGAALGSGRAVLHVDTDLDLGLAARLDVTLQVGGHAVTASAVAMASRDEQTALWRVEVAW